ncbi:tRNA synthetase class I (I, L, M and V) family protein [Artemisia annua]|uniref:tRNA synthetase class I (I, L, M and V) family protein n=1 Tax=Artemisia annua TaxID=35608 RepID=A0A2U1MM03_ARTAN|nr:tRNA synthetase class I (I, L, M and V) family protein [Artemisia annua]
MVTARTGKLIAFNLEAEVYLHSSDDNIALRLRIMYEAKSDVDSPNRIFLTSEEAGCLAKARKLGTLCSRQCLKYNFEYVDFLSMRMHSTLVALIFYHHTISGSARSCMSDEPHEQRQPTKSYGNGKTSIRRIECKFESCDRDDNYTDETRNVVYKEVLHRL